LDNPTNNDDGKGDERYNNGQSILRHALAPPYRRCQLRRAVGKQKGPGREAGLHYPPSSLTLNGLNLAACPPDSRPTVS